MCPGKEGEGSRNTEQGVWLGCRFKAGEEPEVKEAVTSTC